jgi:hypothetical protein
MASAQDEQHDTEMAVRATEAQRIIADCDQRLARYRATLEAGTDPKLVAGWTAEVTATRAAAQVIAEARPPAIMYEDSCPRLDTTGCPTRSGLVDGAPAVTCRWRGGRWSAVDAARGRAGERPTAEEV